MIRSRHQPRHEEHRNGPAGDPDRVTGSAAHPRPGRDAARSAEATTQPTPSPPLTGPDRLAVAQLNIHSRLVRAPSSSRADGSPRSGADLPPAPLRRFRRPASPRLTYVIPTSFGIPRLPADVRVSGQASGLHSDQLKNNRRTTEYRPDRPDDRNVSAYTVRSFGFRDGPPGSPSHRRNDSPAKPSTVVRRTSRLRVHLQSAPAYGSDVIPIQGSPVETE